MFADDSDWDTPKSVKVLNETIFKLPAERQTSKKKKSRVTSDLEKQTDIKVVKNSDHCAKPCKANVASAAAASLSDGHRKKVKTEVSEDSYSVEFVKKRKLKKKHSVSSDDGGSGTCIHTLDDCSSLIAVKPGAKLKSGAKGVKKAQKGSKSECSNDTGDSTPQCLVSDDVRKSSLLDSSVPGKKRKRKDHEAAVKVKKCKTVDDKSHVVRNCSVGPVKHNFNIAQLRSALRQRDMLSDAVLQQERSHGKNDTLQIAEKTETAPAEYDEQIDTDVLEASSSSLPSDMLIGGSSSGGSLKERMTNRLASSRFRFINEQLYRSTGSEAAEMFARDRDAFAVYHEGFQSQVSKWPANPVDRMIDYINSSGQCAVVADFGCGDAKIARSVLNVVHSFDLVALNKHVTACDMAHVPLKKASVDIAVFCLSLMGTNTVDYLVEASRVLKLGGILLIAEVISRFKKIGSFVRKLRKLGFASENQVVSKMFVWFELKKVGAVPAEDCMPSIELYPCLYKKR